MRRRIIINRGSYTVEGAFCIVIFTALIMMLLSLITVIETETEIASALNQTAMQLSQYSYALSSLSDDDGNEAETLKSIFKSLEREALGTAAGSMLAKTLTKDRIDEKALYYVDGGYAGIDFSASNVLGDGKNITVTAVYEITVPTYGLIDKKLTVCQKAKTRAWLPYNSEDYAAAPSKSDDADKSSVWNESNFVRGKYFVKLMKDKYPGQSVKSGLKIDLYDPEKGKASEVFSMNIFSASYSENSKDLKNAEDFIPRDDAVKKQLSAYVRGFKKDIRETGSHITMESGAEEAFSVKEKELIIFLPSEAKGLPGYDALLDEFKKQTLKNDGIIITFVYSEDAL